MKNLQLFEKFAKPSTNLSKKKMCEILFYFTIFEGKIYEQEKYLQDLESMWDYHIKHYVNDNAHLYNSNPFYKKIVKPKLMNFPKLSKSVFIQKIHELMIEKIISANENFLPIFTPSILHEYGQRLISFSSTLKKIIPEKYLTTTNEEIVVNYVKTMMNLFKGNDKDIEYKYNEGVSNELKIEYKITRGYSTEDFYKYVNDLIDRIKKIENFFDKFDVTVNDVDEKRWSDKYAKIELEIGLKLKPDTDVAKLKWSNVQKTGVFD